MKKSTVLLGLLGVAGVAGVYAYNLRVVDTFVGPDGTYKLRADGIIVLPDGKRIRGANWDTVKRQARGLPGPSGIL